MNNDNKISIIVPAYNIENYISRCLDSILNQNYRNIEIIVVNDGSIDKTAKILDEYQEKYTNVIVLHKKNEGVFQARIDGINKASGDWIGFVDGDDEIEVDMFDQLLNNALQYDADISHCGYQMIFPNNRVDKYYGTNKLVIQDHQQGIIDLISGKYIEPGLWNKLYKKSLFEKVDFSNLDTTIKINEDLLLNYFLFKESIKSVFIDKCFYHYMIRKNSAATSKINENKLSDPLKVLNIISKDMRKTDPGYNEVLIRKCALLVRQATMVTRSNPKLIKLYKIKARKELSKNLIKYIINPQINKKLKIMSVWAVISPNSYGLIHRVYSKITGLDKKYSVD